MRLYICQMLQKSLIRALNLRPVSCFCIKKIVKKMNFCEHLCLGAWYYNTRKPPNTLYSFLLHPIRNKKYLLRKKPVERRLVFSCPKTVFPFSFFIPENRRGQTRSLSFLCLSKKFQKTTVSVCKIHTDSVTITKPVSYIFTNKKPKFFYFL